MDFDSKNKILYTGDEMGNMHKWDLSKLIDKLTEFDKKMDIDKHSGYGIREFKETLNQFEEMHNFDKEKSSEERKGKNWETQEDKSNTFLTSAKVNSGNASKGEEEEDKSDRDVFLVNRWKAHTDGITWVTYNEDPTFIATSSFDKNVYIWNENCEKIGSLVLGHDKHWNIHIDKSGRQKRELEEAELMFDEAEREDNENGADGDRTNKERDLKIMEQLREFQRKKNIRKKSNYDF